MYSMENGNTIHSGIVILKFGGTSLKSAECWESVAKILRQRISDGLRPLVVCSAVSQVSNRLEGLFESALAGFDPGSEVDALVTRHEKLAMELGIDLPAEARQELDRLRERLVGISLVREASPRLQAQVLAAGEHLSTRIGAAWLNTQGLPTRWLDVEEWLDALPADDSDHHQYLSATCDHSPDPESRERFQAFPEAVLLTQGFLARAPDGGTALLGRGGSDTSATSLGAKLGARHVEIWTDVPGLFTADPRRVAAATKLDRIGYEEAGELTTRGAKVLHPRSLAPAREARIPIHVRNTGDPSDEGTIIDAAADAEETPSVLAISSRSGMTVLSMDVEGTWQQVGVIADISACFARHQLSIDSIASSQTRVTVSLDPAAHPLDDETLEALMADLREICRPTLIAPATSISVVGRHLRCVLQDMPSLYRALKDEEVHLISHAAHDHSLTFVVNDERADRIVGTLHVDLMKARASLNRRESDSARAAST
jgi:diaminopimelate decarboxylase/aspartate kinase